MKLEIEKEETIEIVKLLVKIAEGKKDTEPSVVNPQEDSKEKIKEIIAETVGETIKDLTPEQRLELAKASLEALKGGW